MFKFDLLNLRTLNLINDTGSFLCCFPSYFIIMYPQLRSMIVRDDGGNSA